MPEPEHYVMHEGDQADCVNCGGLIQVDMSYSGLHWVHYATGIVWCPASKGAAPKKGTIRG